MGLHVDVLAAEESLGPLAGEVLGDVDELASAVVSLARIPFGILVRHHAAAGDHDGFAGIVLTCDHFQAAALPVDFACDGVPEF